MQHKIWMQTVFFSKTLKKQTKKLLQYFKSPIKILGRRGFLVTDGNRKLRIVFNAKRRASWDRKTREN